LEAFLTSTALVAVAEIGDKTQLLSFVLAARLRKPWPIIVGILVATLANHAAAAWVGNLASDLASPAVLRWTVGLCFLGFGLWALHPDSLENAPRLLRGGAFVTALTAFFLAEMGDKTQFATIALAARFDSLAAVILGTTIGMMLANIPAVWVGERLAERLPLKAARLAASGLFIIIGILTFWNGQVP
jgi:putative Ca2+/H+ antiporter (TMEM165/GDT1 family)